MRSTVIVSTAVVVMLSATAVTAHAHHGGARNDHLHREPQSKIIADIDSNAAAAVPAGALCDGAVCVGGEVCCGGLVCYIPSIQQCCLSPTFAICDAGYVCVPSEGGCIPGQPAPANLTCGSVNCTEGWQCCGNAYNGQCYDNSTSFCCVSDVNWEVCSASQSCNYSNGQCSIPTAPPAVPICGNAQCISNYSCCGNSSDGQCYDGANTFCCSSGGGANWQVCGMAQACNQATGQCYTPTPAPTVPMCGGAECLAPNFCCGTRCYDPSYSYCCSAGAKWVVCNNGQTCDAATGQCRSPATPAPAPPLTPAPTTGPQCGGRPCALPNFCCGSQCYNPEYSFCCTAGAGGWAVCNSGQTCNATTGQCQTQTSAPTAAPTTVPTAAPTPVPTPQPIPTPVPTPPPTLAPSAGPQCGGYPCAVPNGCCGNQTYGRCFNPTDTFCCASGTHWALCNLGQTCNTTTARCETSARSTRGA